ncbi:MAG: hypothetical protein AAF567_14580 [Actinomycetota bacterium]
MRKFIAILAAALMASLAFAGTAAAQEAHIGMLESDPPIVPEAGEYTLTATGTDWLPDTSILLVSCISPADTLTFGESSVEEITEAALAIDPLTHCDLATAVPIDVDGDGNFSAELTAEVGDNFFFSAGALDGSQAGATWIPIGDPAAAAGLADTGVETGLLAVIGTAVLGAGVLVVREARRHD